MQIFKGLGLGLVAGGMVMSAGAVELPRMFSDHGVLQRGEVVPVWGWGEAGESVTVKFGGEEVMVNADKDGAWWVELGKLEANATGRTMTVTGGKSGTVEVKDLLVGEVWMASGQSNMQWSLKGTEGAEEAIAAAKHPAVRMFLTDLTTAVSPQRKVGGSWLVTTPENAPGFSAVGYYFGRKLHQELGVPVGIIRTAWGGKPSEAFTSRETLSSKPEGKALVDRLDEERRKYDETVAMAKYEVDLKKWEDRVAKVKEQNKTAKEKKRLPRRPGKPIDPGLNPSRACSIYNAMIQPWVGYAMKGSIWYQGESNASRAKEYETIFPLMIVDWRKQWKSELSFYFVQLANFRKASNEPGVPDNWAELQNAQLLTLSLPKTGMAVINDIGDEKDIHPRNKLDVGLRLARWALAKDYGKKDIVICGPLYKGSKVEGGSVRIEFDHAKGLKARDGGALKRFEIAGADKKWHWGVAKIDGESVVVSSPDVAKPVAVRYAWASNPEGANLVNGEGLPASLFRTDDWKLSTER